MRPWHLGSAFGLDQKEIIGSYPALVGYWVSNQALGGPYTFYRH